MKYYLLGFSYILCWVNGWRSPTSGGSNHTRTLWRYTTFFFTLADQTAKEQLRIGGSNRNFYPRYRVWGDFIQSRIFRGSKWNSACKIDWYFQLHCHVRTHQIIQKIYISIIKMLFFVCISISLNQIVSLEGTKRFHIIDKFQVYT